MSLLGLSYYLNKSISLVLLVSFVLLDFVNLLCKSLNVGFVSSCSFINVVHPGNWTTFIKLQLETNPTFKDLHNKFTKSRSTNDTSKTSEMDLLR